MKRRTSYGNEKEQRVLLLTGQTLSDVQDEIREFKTSGKRPPDRCFLCGRDEGAESIIWDVKHQRVTHHTIELHRITRRLDDKILVYRLCADCALLVRVHDDTDRVFIPACKN